MMLLLFGFTLLTNIGVVFCISLSDFYPFGSTRSDSSLLRNDDSSSSAIDLSFTFPYFDKNYDVVYVSKTLKE